MMKRGKNLSFKDQLKIVLSKVEYFVTGILLVIAMMVPLGSHAQEEPQTPEAILDSLETLVTTYQDRFASFTELYANTETALIITQERIDELESVKAQYETEGEVARALAVGGQIIEETYTYRDIEIDRALYGKLIPIYTQDLTAAQSAFNQYEFAYLGDPQTADNLSQTYFGLLSTNYAGVQTEQEAAQAQQALLVAELGDLIAPEGRDALVELSAQTAEVAQYTKLRQEHFKNVVDNLGNYILQYAKLPPFQLPSSV